MNDELLRIWNEAVKVRWPFAKFVDLLPRVRNLWRCGDGLFFEVPPLASDAFLTMFHPLLENVLQTVNHKFLASELPFHGWKSPEIAWGEI
jgi:hypothetical protein